MLRVENIIHRGCEKSNDIPTNTFFSLFYVIENHSFIILIVMYLSIVTYDDKQMYFKSPYQIIEYCIHPF